MLNKIGSNPIAKFRFSVWSAKRPCCIIARWIEVNALRAFLYFSQDLKWLIKQQGLLKRIGIRNRYLPRPILLAFENIQAIFSDGFCRGF